jgi:hypothetical protein
MADQEEISLLDEIRRLADADPFVPFALVMASGGRHEITAGEVLTFGRNVVYVFGFRSGVSLLRPNQISEVIVPGGAT